MITFLQVFYIYNETQFPDCGQGTDYVHGTVIFNLENKSLYVCIYGVGWMRHTCNFASTREERDVSGTGNWPQANIDLLGTVRSSDSLSRKKHH